MSETTGESSDPDVAYQGDVQPFVALSEDSPTRDTRPCWPHHIGWFEGFVLDQGVLFRRDRRLLVHRRHGPGAGADVLVHNG